MIRTLVLLALVQTYSVVVNAGTANVRLRGILVLGSSICGCGGVSLIISGNCAGGGSFDPGIGACDSGKLGSRMEEGLSSAGKVRAGVYTVAV